MNNKILSIKRNSAIFLATVLVTGIIALSSPSFMVGAHAEPQYGMEREYGSYEQPEYGMDNSYKKSSYRNDYYEQPREYPSYKEDYKSKKDSSSTVNINKLNCINNNVNINGNNTGDINVGNSGKSATGSGTDEGYLGVGSFGGYGEEGYGNNGYNKQKDEGFTCIINNNNTNINIEAGNATDGNGNVTETTCEECFAQVLNVTELGHLIVALEGLGINVNIAVGTPQIVINSLGELCDVLENLTGAQVVSVVTQILRAVNIVLTPGEFFELVTCIWTAFDITIPRTLAASNTNTATSAFDINTAGGLASSFSSPPTIAQGIEQELSATEKITKLETQWLDLLP